MLRITDDISSSESACTRESSEEEVLPGETTLVEQGSDSYFVDQTRNTKLKREGALGFVIRRVETLFRFWL